MAATGEAARRFDTILHMTRRSLSIRLLSLAVFLSLVFAPAASAYNDGRGFYGATNDKVVTDAGFILIVFFPTFVFAMSMLQRHLEKRKQARKTAHKTLSKAQLRGGW
jgi:preprotein translocase subunit SecG